MAIVYGDIRIECRGVPGGFPMLTATGTRIRPYQQPGWSAEAIGNTIRAARQPSRVWPNLDWVARVSQRPSPTT
jgi:hypothetical protein